MNLSEYIFNYLIDNCISKTELSKKAGISVITLNKILNNEVVNTKSYGKLAKAMNVSASELLKYPTN